MSFQDLPTEVLLGILEKAQPNDLLNVSATCKRLYAVTCRYDSWLCRLIVGEPNLPLTTSTKPDRSLPMIATYWNYMKEVGSVSSEFFNVADKVRPGFHTLFEFRYLVGKDITNPRSERYRFFMASKSRFRLREMQFAIETCAVQMIDRFSKLGYMGALCVNSRSKDFDVKCLEAVVWHGAAPLAELLNGGHEVAWTRVKSCSTAVASTIHQDIRWKAHLATIGVQPSIVSEDGGSEMKGFECQ